MVLTLFSSFVIMMLLRVPIAISLSLATVFVLMQSDFNMNMVPQRMFSALDSFALMAIPGFVLAGVILARGGISKYLIEALRTWVGHLPGGLSVVTILACMVFAAISGSSPATAAAIGSIMIPAMVSAGYDKKYSMGLVAAAGTLGILIPPSIPLIIYGITAEESIGKLFMAGVIPGVLLGGVLIVSAIYYAKRNGYGSDAKSSGRERIKASIKALWGAFLPILILGSIYTGIATPTESAVIAVAYGLIVSVGIYREMGLKDIRPIMTETINITSMIFLIIAAASLFGLYLTNEQVPQTVGAWIAASDMNKWMFFLIVNILFFIMGTFLEAVSVILITLPILLPIIKHLGIDPIHFAIVMTVNMELAMITPPVGLNLFVVGGIAKEKLEVVVRGVIPFIILFIFVLAFFVIFPQLSLWLPNMMQ
ncbi:TRAP transporter large permease [Aneurinibacillus aneurinilyticus]|uniref:TRAP transporter large permease subunit n=3 Tax=Aneurinibacillus aneurinilyticus TaxID=1391 RepID=A0A848CYE4_ANEAE|nr:TRAP transporter large permease subunit [Aneurinibacillus aneurinilyticus]ERI10590.1 TRAP transporter, DctM subunit [Aneurinibacillus aneurinilyticus ATCC 12856]MCI1696226.1 TRAP transporter large permease subunit [Aneurinibacillus aneurinilyticus]MED0672144.1 TRAP transporter large permease subunit [Aneurinibacillus aneurinilyticus]MED0706793.1 TRAP transporter large permease subunit [Aneurinibacillus aneurinilyticus]MED0723791.1 TRAP transporter large permease subunit [Aneurinibacillus an